MAYTFKSRRLAMDNIANGSAAGRELHITGGGGIETTRMILDSVAGSGTSTIELPIKGTSDYAGWMGGRPGTATTYQDIEPTSATTPGYTSTTSWTTVFPERL